MVFCLVFYWLFFRLFDDNRLVLLLFLATRLLLMTDVEHWIAAHYARLFVRCEDVGFAAQGELGDCLAGETLSILLSFAVEDGSVCRASLALVIVLT